jgi:hypothetical protein
MEDDGIELNLTPTVSTTTRWLCADPQPCLVDRHCMSLVCLAYALSNLLVAVESHSRAVLPKNPYQVSGP